MRRITFLLPLMIVCLLVSPVQAAPLRQDPEPGVTPTLPVDVSPTVEETSLPPDTATPLPTETVPPTATETMAVASETPTETATLTATLTPEPAASESTEVSEEMVRILVGLDASFQWQGGETFAGILQGADAAGSELAKIGFRVFNVPALQVEQFIAEISAQPGVIYAGQDEGITSQDILPNDTYFSSQWGLEAIQAPEGWSLATGGANVTIAIVDSGVDLDHPDLASHLLSGYDFVNSDDTPDDDYGHGTHVAGIASAVSNNGQGVAGVSWGAQILPVKILNNSGNGSIANAAAGIIYAVDHGAQIVNLSIAVTNPAANTTALEAAINYAASHGVMVVASSGNFGSSSLAKPAVYESVIAVGATNSSNQLLSLSNYGPGLDLVAPGSNIISTTNNGGYGSRTGTSMSAAYVSGLAALLWSLPGNGSAALVESEMKESALDLGDSGYDTRTGFGLIQVYGAIVRALTGTPTATSLPTTVPSTPSPTATGMIPPESTATRSPESNPTTDSSPAAPAQTPSPTFTPGTPAAEEALDISAQDDTPTPTATLAAALPSPTATPTTQSGSLQSLWLILIPVCGILLLVLLLALTKRKQSR